MRKTLLRAETVPQVGDMPAEPLRLRNYQKPADPMADADDEAVAAYLLDLMIAARRMAANRGFSFLAYLTGVAAEESRMLTLGRSAAGQKGTTDKR